MGVKWAYIFMINRYYFIDWRRMFWPVSVINTKLISGVCCCCRRCRALTMIPLVYISKSLFLVILLILIFIIIDDRSLFVCCFCFAACKKARNSLLIMINCIECVCCFIHSRMCLGSTQLVFYYRKYTHFPSIQMMIQNVIEIQQQI